MFLLLHDADNKKEVLVQSDDIYKVVQGVAETFVHFRVPNTSAIRVRESVATFWKLLKPEDRE